MTTNSRGGEALIAAPLKKNFFADFLTQRSQLETEPQTDRPTRPLKNYTAIQICIRNRSRSRSRLISLIHVFLDQKSQLDMEPQPPPPPLLTKNIHLCKFGSGTGAAPKPYRWLATRLTQVINIDVNQLNPCVSYQEVVVGYGTNLTKQSNIQPCKFGFGATSKPDCSASPLVGYYVNLG